MKCNNPKCQNESANTKFCSHECYLSFKSETRIARLGEPPACKLTSCDAMVPTTARGNRWQTYCSAACKSKARSELNLKGNYVHKKKRKSVIKMSGESHQLLTDKVWLANNRKSPTKELGEELGVSASTIIDYFAKAGLNKIKVVASDTHLELNDPQWLEDNKERLTSELSEELGVGCEVVLRAYAHANIKKPIKKPYTETREYVLAAQEKLSNVNWLKSVSHHTYQAIADELGVGVNMICVHFKKMGIQNDNTVQMSKHGRDSYSSLSTDTSSKLNDTEWLNDNNHLTLVDIAQELNTTEATVKRYYKNANIEKHRIVNDVFRSKGEIELEVYIRSCTDVEVIISDRTLLDGLELDIYVPEKKLAFEFNGAYWHAELQGKDKEYHLNKTKLCKAQGIHLIHIWDYEWQAKKELIKSRIKSKLGVNTRIFARKCQVQEINSPTSKLFMNDNHIQGNCPASIRYGIFHEGGLIGVMTFGKSRYDKKCKYELLRYCTVRGVNIVGGAGKLFNRFMRDYNNPTIISYSDRRWNNGGVYEAIGFTHSHSTDPSYYYTKDYTTFENRVAYQKHKLKDKLDVFDPDKTEWQNMQDNSFDRIWDCGTDVFKML